MNSKNGKDRLRSTSTTKEMAHGTLGTTDVDIGGFLPTTRAQEEGLDGCIFGRVADGSRCCVGIDVVHHGGLEICISQGFVHGH